MTPTILLRRLPEADAALPIPAYETKGAAGADVRADLSGLELSDFTLEPGERALIPTGFAVEIPFGFELQVRPRSGLALKHGLSLVNTPGTIDSDYRGPLGIIVVNLGQEPITINHGDRIAQLVVAPVVRAEFLAAETLSVSDRGESGFGSTGRD